MVKLSSSPYSLQENKTIDGKVIEYGELLANGRYISPEYHIEGGMLLQEREILK